ncbi:hypothetical protein EV207_11177 [Scopulibacillus darangshiensis]|uniref:Uncharacterized protein n=1 Tax=Scopulibacillus darangshiensis TaxID=442528 RepID=A0A4R2P659_9BACL|nr:hypothetical protein [Scopulibacillus darangshiensis]TCP29275.1 hypothetical protein EV207_11177 [Scopulibacillus darangshiensis]
MVVLLIIILFIVGVLCLLYMLSQLGTQRRFAFKNKKMMKSQQMTILIGVVGIILIVVSWFVIQGN